MSDPRYKGGITAGILKSHQHGEWPEVVPRLGPRVFGTYSMCQDCREEAPRHGPQWTGHSGGWHTYGGRPLCKRHAQERCAIAVGSAGLELVSP